MDAYDDLRKQARDKRDRAILAARAEYETALAAIRSLKAKLTGETLRKRPGGAVVPKQRPIIDLICDVLPADRTFTVAEIRDRLHAIEPSRVFRSLKPLLHKLKSEGVIRPVSREGRGRVQWEYVAPRQSVIPFAALALTDAAEVVLRDAGPLRTTDLAVALQQRGYRADADPRVLVDSLGKALKRCVGRFAYGDGRRWIASLAGD